MFSINCDRKPGSAHFHDAPQTKKWAFAHWCASTVLTLRHNSFFYQLYAATMEKTNQREAGGRVPNWNKAEHEDTEEKPFFLSHAPRRTHGSPNEG
jgi:hypothetical protein